MYLVDNETMVLPPMRVRLTRIPYGSFVTLTLDDGASEDLEPDDAKEWFRVRGANMLAVEEALDYVWNFYETEFLIQKPKRPPQVVSRLTPRI